MPALATVVVTEDKLVSVDILRTIRAIGTGYLEHHPEPTLLHSNQAFARNLAILTDTYTEEELEFILVNLWLRLPNTNGSLAQKISKIYQEIFGKTIPNAQEHTATLEEIQAIGKNYLAAHPSYVPLVHTNQEIAKAIVDFAPEEFNQETAKKFLIDQFYRLNRFHGDLAAAIKKYFAQHFNEEIDRKFLMSHFPLEFVHSIGDEYLKNHPTRSPWYVLPLFRHTHQTTAEKLKNFVIPSMPFNENVSAQELKKQANIQAWFQLLWLYPELENCDSTLAKQLENLITNAFGIATPEKVLAQGGNYMPLSMHQIATNMANDMDDMLKIIFPNRQVTRRAPNA